MNKFLSALLHRIRLLSKARKEPYLFWYKLLGFFPNDLALYNLALCHRSARQRDKNGRLLSNERLEFLGDAVLGSIVADALYARFPNEREDFLTKTRAKLVCRNNLNVLAKKHDLGKYLRKSPYISEDVENILGNAMEALVGAIYLDCGYTRCREFVLKNVVEQGLKKAVKKEVDFKSHLLEWAQRHKRTVVFELLEEKHIEATNKYLFCYQVCIDGKSVARANGRKKIEAQQQAAKMALRHINKSLKKQ